MPLIKFDVLNRFTAAVQFTAEISCAEDATRRVKVGLALKWAYDSDADLRDADLRGAVLRDADLRGAVLSGADLSGADLRGADLSDADLSDADLRGADLSGAVLRDADLRGADLSGAVLRDADLRGADLRDADIPVIPNIDDTILAAINAGGTLNMGNWHTCETTHCRAGWAIHLAGDKGRELERRYGSAAAGVLIYAASRPGKTIPNFYAGNDEAMADIRASAAEQVSRP